MHRWISNPDRFRSIRTPSACCWDGSFSCTHDSRASPLTDPELAEAAWTTHSHRTARRKSEIDYVLNRITHGQAWTSRSRTQSRGAMRRLGLAGAKSNTKFVPDDYLFNSRSMCASPFFRVCSIPTVVRYTQRGRTCRIQFGTVVRSPAGSASYSWSSHSAASRTPRTEARRYGSLAGARSRRYTTASRRTHPRHPSAGGRRSIPARPQGREIRRHRRRSANAVHSTASSLPQAPKKQCAFRSLPRTRYK